MACEPNDPDNTKAAARLAEFQHRVDALKPSLERTAEAYRKLGKVASMHTWDDSPCPCIECEIKRIERRRSATLTAVLDRFIAVLPWALGLIFVMLLWGLMGAGEYEDAKTLEKTICARSDRPAWCDHRDTN